MFMETNESRVAGEVFQELSENIRQHNYRLIDDERKAFTECSAEIFNRLLTWCGGSGIACYALSRALAGGGKSTRWGRLAMTTSGIYIGGQIGVRGIKEACLERVVVLPTPLGTEAAALLRAKAPDSRLLAARPSELEGGELMPRIAAAAAMQQAHQKAGVDLPPSHMYGAEAQESPVPQRSSADQQPIPEDEQPEAFGPVGDMFGSIGAGIDWPSSSSTDGNSHTHDSHEYTPKGLDTIHRPRRPHRRFSGSDLREDGQVAWSDDPLETDSNQRSF